MALLDANFALITHPNPRAISNLIPDIVVEEICHDTLTVTEFPVETGAPISDHTFNRQPEIIMRCGFSNSTAQSEGYVQAVYQLLLLLQAAHEPFDVTTGKRQYRNMLISSLLVTTDYESEYALNVVVGLKGVIITSASGGGAMFAGTANQALPEQTSGINQSGQLSPIGLGTGTGAIPLFN